MAGAVHEKRSMRLYRMRYLLVRRRKRDPALVEVEQLSADEPVLPGSQVSMSGLEEL